VSTFYFDSLHSGSVIADGEGHDLESDAAARQAASELPLTWLAIESPTVASIRW
jgi:hypothetical protein